MDFENLSTSELLIIASTAEWAGDLAVATRANKLALPSSNIDGIGVVGAKRRRTGLPSFLVKDMCDALDNQKRESSLSLIHI